MTSDAHDLGPESKNRTEPRLLGVLRTGAAVIAVREDFDAELGVSA